jgi:hypothetical protein
LVGWLALALGACGDSSSGQGGGGGGTSAASTGTSGGCHIPFEDLRLAECVDCAKASSCFQQACECTGECAALVSCYEACDLMAGESCADECEFAHPNGYASAASINDCINSACTGECSLPLGRCWSCRIELCQDELDGCVADPSCNQYLDCMGPELDETHDAACRAGATDTTAIDALFACQACADFPGCSMPEPG